MALIEVAAKWLQLQQLLPTPSSA